VLTGRNRNTESESGIGKSAYLRVSRRGKVELEVDFEVFSIQLSFSWQPKVPARYILLEDAAE
jgi:hypothetical protein